MLIKKQREMTLVTREGKDEWHFHTVFVPVPVPVPVLSPGPASRGGGGHQQGERAAGASAAPWGAPLLYVMLHVQRQPCPYLPDKGQRLEWNQRGHRLSPGSGFKPLGLCSVWALPGSREHGNLRAMAGRYP